MSGRVGYNAYAEFTGGKTFDGRDMPTWDALPERIRGAWEEAARAILVHGPATAPAPEGYPDETLRGSSALCLFVLLGGLAVAAGAALGGCS